MSANKKSRVMMAVLSLMISLVLIGCGEKMPLISEAEGNMIYLTKDGKVTAFLVESFDKEYYSETELEKMILSEVEDYNSQAGAGSQKEEGQPVVLTDILSPEEKQEMGLNDAKTITVQLDYVSAQDYSAYNDTLLYWGTVAQAKTDGYPIQKDLSSPADGSALTKAQAQEMGENHLLVLQESIPVQVPYKVLYVSSGVTVEGNTVTFDGTEGGFAYVIMK